MSTRWKTKRRLPTEAKVWTNQRRTGALAVIHPHTPPPGQVRPSLPGECVSHTHTHSHRSENFWFVCTILLTCSFCLTCNYINNCSNRDQSGCFDVELQTARLMCDGAKVCVRQENSAQLPCCEPDERGSPVYHVFACHHELPGTKQHLPSMHLGSGGCVHPALVLLHVVSARQTGFDQVMRHPRCVNEIALSLNNRNPR